MVESNENINDGSSLPKSKDGPSAEEGDQGGNQNGTTDRNNSNSEGVTTTNTAASNKRDEKTERRMEINRLRAKEIRKRKKEMEADMQQQIIKLTLENNSLRSQIRIQDDELKLLRGARNLHPHQLIGTGTNPFGLIQASPVPHSATNPLLQNANLFGDRSLHDGLNLGMLGQMSNNANQMKSITNVNGLGVIGNQMNNFSNLSGGLGLDTPQAFNISEKDPKIPGLNASSSTSPQDVDEQQSAAEDSSKTTKDQDEIMKLLGNSSASVRKSLLEKLQEMDASEVP